MITRMTRRIAVMAVLVSAFHAGYAQDLPTVEELISKMANTFSETKTWSADTEMSMNMMGMKMSTTGTMIMSGTKSASTMKMMMEVPEEMKSQVQGSEAAMLTEGMEMKTVMGDDNIQWMEMKMGPMTQVMKMDMAKVGEMAGELMGGMNPFGGGNPMEMMQDPQKLMDMYSTMFDMKVARADTIDGTKVYVLEGTIKETFAEQSGEAAAMMQAMGGFGDRISMAIGAADGFMRQMTMGGETGPPVMTMTMKNLKTNIDVPDGTFAYTPPAGVEVMDMSEMLEQAAEGAEANGKFKVGEAAPDFDGKTLDGKTIKLSDYKGKVVLIDFWATWCGPCMAELPNVVETYERYHSKGLEIVGVSLDDEESALKGFFKDQPKVTWPSLFDGKGWDGPIVAQYGVVAIPYTALIGKDGVIVATDLRGEALGEAVAKCLEAE